MWIIFIIILIVAIPIVAIISESNENKKKNKEMSPYKEKNNAILSEKCWHLTGLPLTERKECIVSLCKDKIIVETGNIIYNLPLNKIKDLNIMTSKEIQNSISNAVAGSMLFGPLGVVLMGSSTQINRIFTIIYTNKEDSNICLSFDLGDNIENFQGTQKYIESLKTKMSKKEVEL